MKKHLLFILILSAFGIKAKAQTGSSQSDSVITPTQKPQRIEKTAEFPGGIDKLYQFINKNKKNGDCVGRVIVTFSVEKDGRLSDIRVAKGLSPECDAEAIRVMSKSPAWTPAIQGIIGQNVQAVKVAYTLPINFGE